MNSDTSSREFKEISKLRWHCRRGVKELDVVLNRYLDTHYLHSREHHKNAFESLLSLEDPALMGLLFDGETLQNEDQQAVLDLIKKPLKIV